MAEEIDLSKVVPVPENPTHTDSNDDAHTLIERYLITFVCPYSMGLPDGPRHCNKNCMALSHHVDFSDNGISIRCKAFDMSWHAGLAEKNWTKSWKPK